MVENKCGRNDTSLTPTKRDFTQPQRCKNNHKDPSAMPNLVFPTIASVIKYHSPNLIYAHIYLLIDLCGHLCIPVVGRSLLLVVFTSLYGHFVFFMVARSVIHPTSRIYDFIISASVCDLCNTAITDGSFLRISAVYPLPVIPQIFTLRLH